jgi:glycosyltransferase involved in cell wall biosynthesis
MLLSICIPIYNTDIRPLADELNRQIQAFTSEVELLFLDDASDVFFKEKNRSVGKFSDYQELPENIGRSKIRNAFIPFVKGKYMLFIDGDSQIIHADFIEKYVVKLRSSAAQVLIGASVYADNMPSRDQRLRWTYSRTRESLTYAARMQNPNHGFKSNNFIIEKELFKNHPFDERLTTYGHEDTLFGYQLRKAGVQMDHMDNPVLNSNLDDNATFLKKTKEALCNLWNISRNLKDPQFNEDQKLLRMAITCQRSWWKKSMVQIIRPIVLPLLSYLLARGYTHLSFFDAYRFLQLERLISHGSFDERY